MRDRELKTFLRRSLRQEACVDPSRLEETVWRCIKSLREQKTQEEELRLGFWGYLSEVFRFDGIPILGLQAVSLLLVCLFLWSFADGPENLPGCMPLFVLAFLPVVFRGQYYGMSEMEAATRTSGAQMMLARLILAGGADLLCITGLLGVSASLHGLGKGLGRMLLYCVVPYLTCMVALLRMTRWNKRGGIWGSIAVLLGFCVFWGSLAKAVPWLYETSAAGIWVVAAVLFSLFFAREICYIAKMGKEGKLYGTIV